MRMKVGHARPDLFSVCRHRASNLEAKDIQTTVHGTGVHSVEEEEMFLMNVSAICTQWHESGVHGGSLYKRQSNVIASE